MKQNLERSYSHLMIDLETLSNPNQNELIPIASIGIVEFDPYSQEYGRKMEWTVSLYSCVSLGAKTNVDTIGWWLGQSDDARKHIINACTNGEHIALVLYNLTNFIHTMQFEKLVIWCKDPDFDASILRSYYNVLKVVCPWNHHQTRSVRTAMYFAHRKGHKFVYKEPEHSAVLDCMQQIIDIFTSFEAIGIERKYSDDVLYHKQYRLWEE